MHRSFSDVYGDANTVDKIGHIEIFNAQAYLDLRQNDPNYLLGLFAQAVFVRLKSPDEFLGDCKDVCRLNQQPWQDWHCGYETYFNGMAQYFDFIK